MNPFLFQQQSFQTFNLRIPWFSLLATASSCLLLPHNTQMVFFTFRYLKILVDSFIRNELAKMPSPPSFSQHCTTPCFAVLYVIFLIANHTKTPCTLAALHIDSELPLLASNPQGIFRPTVCFCLTRLLQHLSFHRPAGHASLCSQSPSITGGIASCPMEDDFVPAVSTPREPNRDDMSFPLGLIVGR